MPFRPSQELDWDPVFQPPQTVGWQPTEEEERQIIGDALCCELAPEAREAIRRISEAFSAETDPSPEDIEIFFQAPPPPTPNSLERRIRGNLELVRLGMDAEIIFGEPPNLDLRLTVIALGTTNLGRALRDAEESGLDINSDLATRAREIVARSSLG